MIEVSGFVFLLAPRGHPDLQLEVTVLAPSQPESKVPSGL